MLVEGVAAVKGVGDVGVSEVGGVAAPSPGVVAEAFHGVAVDGGGEAALVVFDRVVHDASVVGRAHKDSE